MVTWEHRGGTGWRNDVPVTRSGTG